MRQTLYDFCRKNGKDALLAQWDTAKNLPDTPQTVTHGSHIAAWWQCENGHSWQAPVYSRVAGSGCPYCRGRKADPGFNDLASQFPELAAQWDTEKNAPTRPEDVTVGSHRSAWWRCEKGHSWRAMIRSRVSGCGCPVCARKVVVPGENDLATLYPELVPEWDHEKNRPLMPSQVMPGTMRKVWWRCRLGHSWSASVSQRTGQRAGCPVCAGKAVLAGENDLASQFPELALEWDHEKNGRLTPQQVTASSNRKVWWRCRLGHSYPTVVASRVARSTGCPYCTNRKVLPGFNDLETQKPQVAKEWHPTLNGTLTPDKVTAGSHRRVWWQCANGHVWKAFIYSRASAQNCGCPVCAGTVRSSRKANL